MINKYGEHQVDNDLSTLQDEVKEAKSIENENEKIFTLFELRGKARLLMKMVRSTFFTKPRLNLINSIFDDIGKAIGEENLKIYKGGDNESNNSITLTEEEINKLTYKELQEKIKELEIKDINLTSNAEVLRQKLKEYFNTEVSND